MPSQSVIGAVIERYESFTFANRPAIDFDEAEIRAVGGSSSSALTKPPYVILIDNGMTPDDTQYITQEVTTLQFKVYGTSLAQVDAIVEGIRYNGGTQHGGAGMDFAASLPLLNYNLTHMLVRRIQRFTERERNDTANKVFRANMDYEVRTVRSTA